MVHFIALLIGWLTAAGVGYLFCRAFVPVEDRRDPVLALFGFAMSIGAVGTLMLPMGVFAEYSPKAYALIVSVWIEIAVVVWFAAGRKSRVRKPLGNMRIPIDSLLPWVALIALAFASYVVSVGPPTSNEWDSLAYHLAVPKVWLAAGNISPMPYDHHSNFPMLLELHYAFGGAAMVKGIHWLSGLTCAAIVAWAARRWVSPRVGALSAVLFLAVPVVAWEATTAYVDLTTTMFVSLAVFAIIRWKETPTATGWLWLSALMAGFACGTKMTMLAVAGLLVLWLACLWAWKAAPVSVKRLLAYAGIIALVAGGWYAKTWYYTGNPVYPFAYERLGGRWWSAEAARDYTAEQARFGIGKSPVALLFAPWTTAFQSHYYANPPSVFKGDLTALPKSGFPAVYGGLGIAVIGLLPLWFLARKRHPATVSMVAFSAAFTLVWFGLTHQTRYLIPILPFLIVAGMQGAVDFWRRCTGWRWIIGAFLTLAVVFGLLPAWSYTSGMRMESAGEADYLAKREPMYEISMEANKRVPKTGKILLLQETRGYWLDVPYMWGNPSQNALVPWDKITSPADMLVRLHDLGVTHVIINWGATTPEVERERWPGLTASASLSGYMEPIVATQGNPFRGIVLFELAESQGVWSNPPQ